MPKFRKMVTNASIMTMLKCGLCLGQENCNCPSQNCTFQSSGVCLKTILSCNNSLQESLISLVLGVSSVVCKLVRLALGRILMPYLELSSTCRLCSSQVSTNVTG
uniref:Uncharacterized protein n=1 Tax=Rhizophora mucronata TaxID=61149 RepID=A0A2P2P1N4_RHIMU